MFGGVDRERWVSARASGPSGAAEHQQEQAGVDAEAIAVAVGEPAADGGAADQDIDPALRAASNVVFIGSRGGASCKHQRRSGIAGADIPHLGIDLRPQALRRSGLGQANQHQRCCDGAGGAIEKRGAHDLVSFLRGLRGAAPLGETGLRGQGGAK